MPKSRLSSSLLNALVLAVVITLSALTAATGGTLHPVRPFAPNADDHVMARVSNAYGNLPLYFEANRGQTSPEVKFIAHGSRGTLFLTSNEAVLVFTKPERSAIGKLARVKPEKREKATQTVLRMRFVGATPNTRVEGQEELPGKANYFIGNDPTKWRTNVPTYAKVQYKNVYPGIDLVYYGNQRELEYDFVVGPGADPKRILLGLRGADKLEVDAQGDLVLHTAAAAIRQRKPVIYQEIDGIRRDIAGGYVLKGARRVGFKVAAYDRSRPLIIDPALFYSTYLGGSAEDLSGSIAVDASGNAYVTGLTESLDFPTAAGAFQAAFGGGQSDVFVTKLNPTGSGLVYSTYLGGIGYDQGFGIAVDAGGNAYVTGYTLSSNFPTTAGAFQIVHRGGQDAFVTKLNPTGSGLVYSTYLGGNGSDFSFAIAVDVLGSAYVTGFTTSTDFPTTPGAFQTRSRGPSSTAFVTKVDPTGAVLVYSTYLGGSNGATEQGGGIAVDGAGNAYVIGSTTSTDFPTTAGAFQTALAGVENAFVAKLDPTGASLIYSTYLGGSPSAFGLGIAVDASGNAYVIGTTTSTDFPTTAGAFQTAFGGNQDAFVAKLDPTGARLVYSTYLGGSSYDVGLSIAVDAAGNAYVAGFTGSTDFPTTPGGFQTALGGTEDAFVAKLDPTGASLVYSTYLGGSGEDIGRGIALDTLVNPNAYVTGHTGSRDFPKTPGAFQPNYGGDLDIFVTKITEAAIPPGPFSARVTGGGTIDVVGGIGNFDLIVQQQIDGTLSGRLQYFNHASGARVQSVTITSLTIAANMATFDGTCTVNGAPCTFTAHVTDNGEPGTTDTFTISVDLGPPDGGTLRSGNILIQQF